MTPRLRGWRSTVYGAFYVLMWAMVMSAVRLDLIGAGKVGMMGAAGQGGVEYRAGASFAGIVPGSTFTVTVPASVQTGDVMIIALAVQPTTSTVATPSGWTLVGSSTSTGATFNVMHFLYRKTATGLDAGATVSFLCGVSDQHAAARLAAYSALTGSVDTSNRNASSATVTSKTTTSLTTANAGELIVSVFSYFGNDGVTPTLSTPTGTTSRGAAVESFAAVLIVDEVQGAAGASSTRTSTVTGSAGGGMVAAATALIAS